jgi:Tol biopolymer transport system component
MQRRDRRTVTLNVATCALVVLALASGPSLGADPTPGSGASTTAGSAPAIAYQWVQGSGDGIFLMAPDGSDVRPLFDDLGVSTYHPDWSPDGARLAFEMEGGDGVDIWTSAADGGARALLIDHADCGDGGCADVAYPSWSPDGGSIAYTRYHLGDGGLLTSSIETLDLVTGETRVVVPTSSRTLSEYPRWSPDGRSIVYQFTTFSTDGADIGTETGSAIAIVDASGAEQEPRALTDPGMYAAYPDWGWAIDLIVFTTYDLGEFQGTDEPSNLYTIMPDGSGLTQLTSFGAADQRATQPTWTKDGKRILFTLVGQNPGFDGPRHAALVDATGSGLTVLPPAATHPRLRPDPAESGS